MDERYCIPLVLLLFFKGCFMPQPITRLSHFATGIFNFFATIQTIHEILAQRL
jgi:hypothetical protein